MTAIGFVPKQSGVSALLNKIYEIKFSRHVPLTVVLLSAVYAVYRSQHYLTEAFKLNPYVSIPTAIFLELLVLGASAVTFIAFRNSYIAQLKAEDQDLSNLGVTVALTSLAVAFITLLGVAWADAWLVTHDYLGSFLMTLAQFVQASFIVGFIVNSLLDERAVLRVEYETYQRDKRETEEKEAREKKENAEKDALDRAQFNATHCPHCKKPVSLNNRKRHIASCPSRV